MKHFSSGIYHAVPSGQTTWYGLATLAVECAVEVGVTLKVKPEGIKPILAVEYPLPALRPINSLMATSALGRALMASDNMAALQLLQQSWKPRVATYIQDLVHKKLI
jgi:dTDP-4-dehydrorhamnose reductase